MSRLNINDVRSEALFVSALQRCDEPTAAQVRAAITRAVRRHGSRGCAAVMAQEFGDAPDAAVARMCWARRIVDEVFAAGAAHRATSVPAACVSADSGRAAAVPAVVPAAVPAVVPAAVPHQRAA
jgi:hypothetical protein